MKGLHIIADLYNCQKGELLASAQKLKDLCVATCEEAGLTVLGHHFYQFDALEGSQDGGATGAVVLAESHLAIHTWPERDGATLDVYVCNFTADNTAKAEAVYDRLMKALKPADVMVERVIRGKDLPLKKRVA
ncbi:MAG TPA: adenosylmethionine decarboxylase [Usitatibacter sp.]|nr:adenosylmethionine decarboxylase [Usitatibacter sp.]